MCDIWMDVDTALSEVPVNIMPLLDDTDFKTRETAVAFNAAGMDLVWNFVTSGGAMTQTAVTPTTGGNYDWASQGDGMYSIEIPASGGASINNDTEGFGWFTGVATGVLPWRGPIIGFRAAGLNNKLIDDAYSTTRGLAGTAVPDAAADAAGGLPISDAGGLDLDTFLGRITGNVALASVLGALTDAAADGDPTTTDTIMQYVKQLINVLIGTTGIVTFPASATPANNISLAEVVRQIYDEVANLNGGTLIDAAGVRSAVGLASPNLDTQLGDIDNFVDDLESRLTAARAGYLDNLNVGGNVASSAEVTVIQNNTRVVRVVPDVLERPDSGSIAYRIELLLYDTQGNMEAPDSAPTIGVVNNAGTSRDANLDSTTMALVSTGRYRSTYTVDTNHALEQLIFSFSVVEGGATRVYANPSLTVDTTAVDFTAADRTKLEAVFNKLPSKNFLTGTANSDGDVQLDEATGEANISQTGADKVWNSASRTLTAFGFSVTVGSIGAGVINAAAIAVAAANKLADHIHRRTTANVEASADGDALSGRSLYGAFARLTHRSRVAANVLTVYRSDDSTTLFTQNLTTDPNAEPVVEADTV